MQQKEKIYTIPVNDAFASEEPCPLCSLYAGLEKNLEEFYLGPALMESNVRETTNEHGFCTRHLSALYNSQMNRLGLGLTLHTHLLSLRAGLGEELSQRDPEHGMFARMLHRQDHSTKHSLAEQLRKKADDCVVCRRLDQTMERYLDVIFYQYSEDEDFRNRFQKDKLFCLKHFALLLGEAENYLKGAWLERFTEKLVDGQLKAWEVLTDDVEWFTKKFDYRYKDAPWKNSKDAVSRAIRFLASNPELEGTGFGRGAADEVIHE